MLAAKARTFYNIISGWWVEHFTLTLQNIISELMRQDGRNLGIAKCLCVTNVTRLLVA